MMALRALLMTGTILSTILLTGCLVLQGDCKLGGAEVEPLSRGIGQALVYLNSTNATSAAKLQNASFALSTVFEGLMAPKNSSLTYHAGDNGTGDLRDLEWTGLIVPTGGPGNYTFRFRILIDSRFTEVSNLVLMGGDNEMEGHVVVDQGSAGIRPGSQDFAISSSAGSFTFSLVDHLGFRLHAIVGCP